MTNDLHPYLKVVFHRIQQRVVELGYSSAAESKALELAGRGIQVVKAGNVTEAAIRANAEVMRRIRAEADYFLDYAVSGHMPAVVPSEMQAGSVAPQVVSL